MTSARWVLSRVDVESYGLEPMEKIAAAAVKAYLSGFERMEALELLREILRATVLKIPPLHEKPELLQTRIEGEKLAALIDAAAVGQIEVIRSRQGDAELNRKIIKALEQMDGKMIVQNMSPEFLCFFTDCYKEMRY